jgi:predicted NBD/HSP70 family sugar kinase
MDTQLSRQAQEITLDTVEAAFAAGDPLACQVVLEAANYMGRAISALVGMLNIQDIVLSGELTRFGSPWLEAIRETMLRTSLFGIASDTRVEIGRLDRDGIILGATALLASDYSLLFSPETSQVLFDRVRPNNASGRASD